MCSAPKRHIASFPWLPRVPWDHPVNGSAPATRRRRRRATHRHHHHNLLRTMYTISHDYMSAHSVAFTHLYIVAAARCHILNAGEHAGWKYKLIFMGICCGGRKPQHPHGCSVHIIIWRAKCAREKAQSKAKRRIIIITINSSLKIQIW